MKNLKSCLLLCFLLLLGTTHITAQDDPPSLRELADLNNLDIGAAVYTYHLDNATHGEILGQEFNVLTHEQEAKPCEIQSQRSRFNFEPMDEIVDFAEANDMSVHGHTLVWHSCTPTWIENGDFTRDEAIQYLRDYIMTVVGRYQGRIPVWDVINEGIDDDATIRNNAWHRLIGDDYLELAFQFAHEADPDALLLYNDYGIEGINAKSNAVYEMAQDFVERGIPIHGIGLQGHFSLGTINRSSITQNIERFGELGLEVHFTEIDVRFSGEPTDEIFAQQAEDYRTLLEICLDVEACTTFIVWGVTDRYTWLRGSNLGFFNNPNVAPLLFDDDYEPKPAYFALLDLLAREAGLEPILSDNELATLLGQVTSQVTEIEAPTRSDPQQLAPDSVQGVVYYAPYPVTIELDGEASDWENVPRATIESNNLSPNYETSISFAVTADDSNIYYLADVIDPNLTYGNYEASEWYREDSVEFYLNATGDVEISAYEVGVVQMGLMLVNITEPETPIVGGANSGDVAVDLVIVETDNGYLVEASVPLESDVWSIEPSHLASYGFQVHVNGSSSDDRDSKLIWSIFDENDQSFQNPSVFGELIFWDIDQ